MEFKAYYYEDNQVCIISKSEKSTPEYESINTKENIIINLNDKNVQNIYDFFRDNTIRIILSDNINSISIDYSNIKNEDFYNEESFQKLIELLDLLTKEVNDTIKKCNNIPNKEELEKELDSE